MPARQQRRRRRIAWSSYLLPAGLAVVSLIGLALLASSLGWFGDERTARKSAPAGTIAVPAVAVTIPAYSQIRLEHLVDPQTGDLRAIYLPEGSILPETLVNARDIIGRVVRSDKKPGQLFAEADLFPPGTREGIVAGIPEGKRALRIDASKVNGIVGLGRGDRFDLVATVNLRQGRSSPVVVGGAAGAGVGGAPLQSSIVVENGAVVQPLETRAIPGRASQLVEEMVVAVDPAEVEFLTQALHSGARIDCVPRSGRPVAEAAAPEAPKRSGRSGINVIETISGGSRGAVAVPSSGNMIPATPLTPPAVATGPPRSREGDG